MTATRRRKRSDCVGQTISLRNHPNVAEEIEDLDAESERLAEGEYLASDRKYHLSRSAGSADLRDKYLGKLSRRKKKK